MQFLNKHLKKYTIGFTDSGIGSLIFAIDFKNKSLKELQHLSQKHNVDISLTHLGDNANVPYSTKSSSEVNRLINTSLEKLEKSGAKIGVIACNTACVNDAKFPSVKKLHPMPIINESALELYNQASKLSTDNKINMIVMGTAPTIKSGEYTNALNKIHKSSGSKKELVVHGFSAPEFVTAMETELLNEAKIRDIIAKGMLRMENEIGVQNTQDAPIIGLFCTHYPLFKKYIKEFLEDRYKKDLTLLSQGEILSSCILGRIASDLSKESEGSITELSQNEQSIIPINSYFTSQKGKEIIQHNASLVFGNERMKNITFNSVYDAIKNY